MSEVLLFLERLAVKSKDGALLEYAALAEFAKNILASFELQVWDIAYASEKLRIAKYNVSDEELRAYFPSAKVFEGVFRLIGKIYGMRVEEDVNIPVWREESNSIASMMQQMNFVVVFIRTSTREKKRGGAWMDDCILRRKIAADIQLPVAYLN